MSSSVAVDQDGVHGVEPNKFLLWSGLPRENDVLETDAVTLYQRYLISDDGGKDKEEVMKIWQALIPLNKIEERGYGSWQRRPSATTIIS